MSFISVIIPAYNRENMIGITIESFIKQDYPNDKYEIIIADNNSSDNTKDIITDWQRKSPVSIQYIYEGRQGVHYARNTAAKYSKGNILYFTDDDMIADKKLLKTIVEVFGLGLNVGSATGRVLPKWEVEPPKWVLKYCYNGRLSLHDRAEDLIIAPFDIGVSSCHQAVPREVFFKCGGFNPENTDGEWIGDGETGLNIKIKELGFKFAYVGNSIIYHIIPAERLTQKYLNKRLANQGNCDSYTEYKKGLYNGYELYKRMIIYVIKLVLHLICYYTRLLLLKDGWRINRAYISYYLNRIKYDYRLIREESWREMVLKRDWLDK